MVELARAALHASVRDPAAGSMNFLNEIAVRFPDAISLAAGRPADRFYAVDDIKRYLDAYVHHLAAQGMSGEQIRCTVTQYGRTNGQIHGLIARMLAVDEDIHVPAEAVAVTVGAQEAMILALRGLCAGPDDVLLAASPCYVGITGAARILGVDVVPVPEDPATGVRPADVARVARAVRAAGRNPRALYLVPNFSNPTGVSLDVPVRRALLDVAAGEDLLILEDDPYGLFGLDDTPVPTLKSLDRDRRVLYLGSFAKSCFPGPRVGFLVADQPVVGDHGTRTLLAAELSTVKSMLTVNTSPIAQAVIGGILVESGYSLRAANREKAAFYRGNLRALLAALDRWFPEPARSARGISWNTPHGGFFATLTVPLHADEKLLEVSACDYGVLWTPMSFFYPEGGGHQVIRLSCSWLDPERIDEGVRRLARLVDDRQ